jgi:hypothetical protein
MGLDIARWAQQRERASEMIDSYFFNRPIKTAATAIIYQHRFKRFMTNVKTNPTKEINGHAVDVHLALDRDDEVGAALLTCKPIETVYRLIQIAP